MKTYIKVLLFIFVVPILISSCKDDDETPGAALVGTWEEKSFVSSGCVDPDDNESATCTSSCERIVVTENTVKIGSDPAIPYTINGNQLSITESSGGITITITVTFEVSGNTLTITQQDEASDGGCKNVSTYIRV
ncbi:MAG TPA: hypothetical protein PK185_11590 [Cyclobacteriaceae bacterium]|nr:hypothetical protein [Cyclobacteriaceae bacterium]HRK54550.1 hypothetical protein [Cyclobacteriaceae bacterium]